MTNSTRVVVLTAALLGLVPVAAAQPPTLNDKVVKFCKDKLGEKVGDGECTALASEGLEVAGARRAFEDFPNKGDYVWGKLVYALTMEGGSPDEKAVPGMSVMPGDVIQLRDVRFEGKNGFSTYPHHTSVVLDVKAEGKVLMVLEQNINGKKLVKESTYRLNDLKTGWVRVYRPVPK